MANLFVGPVMGKLIDACFNYLKDYSKDQVRWQTGMKEELERLQKIHPDIQDVVSAYSKAHIKDPNGKLNRWLWKLRDAIDETNDVLDTFEYKKHKEKVRKNKMLRKVRSIMKSMKKRVKRALKIDPDLKKLEEAVQKLEKVSAEVGTFLPLLKSAEKEQQKWDLEFEASRETGSLPTDVVFLGRSDDMKFVVQWLTIPSNEHEPQIPGSTIPYRNISLLSVVGHGGMGKTTLLQHVCKEMTEKEFDVKIWVCVSNDFNAIKVIQGMLESIEKERPRADRLDALQRNLGSAVKSKKFLLVLDDIWEDNDETEWGKVLAPLVDGSLGSKILVTTRMESAASTIAKVIGKDNKILQLKGLEEDECLQLLITHAFAGVKNPDDHKKLRSIAKEMVKKILGSPLAAKVIGGALNSKVDDRYWANVLNSDIGNVEPGQSKLLPILKLSYIYLPKELQNCFAFCSIFPQDHGFDKDDLVRMWIALGFIQSPNIQGETVEDIGGRYFDILVKKSFFEELYKVYKMHDLLHELAQFVSKQECFKIVDDKKLMIPETIRHLSIWSINTYSLEVLQNLEKFKHLRSLFLSWSYDECHVQNLEDVLSKVFNAAGSIRLFFISKFIFEGRIPETIGYLSHLRYLRVCSMFTLPRSINHLYHLQFIICEWFCFTDDQIVLKDFNNLNNLRYLGLPVSGICMVHGIGKLKSLQKLENFYVSDDIGCRIGELEHMNELRQLTICQLENIKDAEEACSAKLCDKSNLTDLSLEWGFKSRVHTADPELDEMVLENIQPPNNLKKLIIIAYMGVRSARWMNNVHLISNLERIELHGCFKWETLPPFGQLPFLKYLYIDEMSEVKRLDNDKDCVFPSLQELHIECLPALQEWFDATLAEENDRLFRCLTKLNLRECPKLQQLPSLPPKLQELRLFNVEWKGCNWLKGISGCCEIEIKTNLVYLCGRQELKANENCQLILNELVINDPSMLLMEPLRSITSLEELKIVEKDETFSFPIEAEEWFIQVSSSLRVLKFESLKSLHTLPSSLESLSSLENLYVLDVPQPQLLPNLPHSLIKLELKDLDSLQCLPSSLSTNSYLTHLQLTNIPLLKSLPDLPSSLELLKLEKLESLQCLPSSLPTISSLERLHLKSIPLLKSLPDLPSFLLSLYLEELQNLDCLPSCLPDLFFLYRLEIMKVPQLRELPDLPAFLEYVFIKNCHPELNERYEDEDSF